MAISFALRKKKWVMFPEVLLQQRYVGVLWGRFFSEPGVFNVVTPEVAAEVEGFSIIGEIVAPLKAGQEVITAAPHNEQEGVQAAEPMIQGWWSGDQLVVSHAGEEWELHPYDLVQRVFSRNTGILESELMAKRRSVIIGCGSVGSFVALELARAGVGSFVLVDNDIMEYHNVCRHQCSVSDVGDYKVHAVSRRIKAINPLADVECHTAIVEQLGPEIWQRYAQPEETIIVGCADNRTADVAGNRIAVLYGLPFISIGFWERAFAGEIFYHLPEGNMPCYYCALGDGEGLTSLRSETNRRFYTTMHNVEEMHFEPGIAVDIDFVTLVGTKLILDILNRYTTEFTPRLLDHLQQYTLVCNTNKPQIGGEMAEIFSYPLQVTTSLRVDFGSGCPPCKEQS